MSSDTTYRTENGAENKIVQKLDEQYRASVAETTEYAFDRSEVTASVIVVTYRTTKQELSEVFDALSAQTCDDFETIVVDNGTEWDLESELGTYDETRYLVRLEENEGVSFARNLGAQIAAGDVLVFLDDDGFPREDFLEQHLGAHEREGVVAVRGKVQAQESNVYTAMQGHYDLGDEVRPAFIGTECNASFDTDVFLDHGGYDEGLAGQEGLELTHRLIQAGFRKDQIIYYPDAVTYHDFASGLWNYVRKQVARKRNNEYFRREHPGLWEFGQSYLTEEDYLERRRRLLVVDVLVAGWLRVTQILRRLK